MPMQHVDPASLADLQPRMGYVTSFLDFGKQDIAYLHAAAPIVKPLVGTVVDAVYTKLLSFDITARAFVPRNIGFTGDLKEGIRGVQQLSHNDEQIKFRKDFLKKYVARLVEMDYNAKDIEYLDKVALMHTGMAGFAHRENKPSVRVELMHCSILLGFVVDIILDAVVKHPGLDNDTKAGVLKAFNKVVWIQNDLFNRYYAVDMDTKLMPTIPGQIVSVTAQKSGCCGMSLAECSFPVGIALVAGFAGWMAARYFTV